jgi:hypothetical protein
MNTPRGISREKYETHYSVYKMQSFFNIKARGGYGNRNALNGYMCDLGSMLQAWRSRVRDLLKQFNKFT